MVVQRLNSHKRKMIAPIIITVIMILYYIAYFGFLISLLGGFWKYVMGIIPLVFSGIMIYVCKERINEIKKREEGSSRLEPGSRDHDPPHRRSEGNEVREGYRCGYR